MTTENITQNKYINSPTNSFSSKLKPSIKKKRESGCYTHRHNDSKDIDRSEKNYEQELEDLWKYGHPYSKLEKFEYVVEKKGNKEIIHVVSDTKPVWTYTCEDLKDKRSFICANCICHEKCPGYYYDRYGSGADGFDASLNNYSLKEIRDNPDIFESLKRKCECKVCKHSLDWRTLK